MRVGKEGRPARGAVCSLRALALCTIPAILRITDAQKNLAGAASPCALFAERSDPNSARVTKFEYTFAGNSRFRSGLECCPWGPTKGDLRLGLASLILRIQADVASEPTVEVKMKTGIHSLTISTVCWPNESGRASV